MKLEVNKLSVKYDDLVALSDVSFTIEGAKIVGLLGRNGAGKSTLIKAMTNMQKPGSGQALVDGQPVWENPSALRSISAAAEQNLFPPGMKVGDIIKGCPDFYTAFDVERATELADMFKLDIKAKSGSLSTGYKTILKNLVALCCNAPFTFLDEPVNGLDAAHRELFYRELLKDYALQPRMIILSTHLVDEVAGLLEDVVIIHKGKLLLHASMDDIMNMGYSVAGRSDAVNIYTQGLDIIGRDEMGSFATAYILGDMPDGLPHGLESSRLSMQKLFIKLTGDEGEAN